MENVLPQTESDNFLKDIQVEDMPIRAYCSIEEQIQMIKKHFTGNGNSVLQADPTFNVGNYYITTTCFRNQDFKNRSNMNGALAHGPVLLHARCEIKDYQYFGEQISNELDAKVNFVGLDGEKALVEGLKRSESFSDSNILTCMKHSRENCVQKLSQCGVGKQMSNKITEDIYGWESDQPGGRTRYLGLMDAKYRRV